MTELKDIINYVIDSIVNSELNLNKGYPNMVSKDMILDCATRIYNSQSFKEIKQSNSVTKSVPAQNEMPKATENQLAYLQKLGYEGDFDKLNLQEAKELISVLKEQRRKEKYGK